MHERPSLPLTTESEIEQAREQVVSRSWLDYSILFSPDAIAAIATPRMQPQRKPATLKLALQRYCCARFDAEAQYYGKHARDETELRSWLTALASCVEAEVVQERRSRLTIFEFHCTAADQKRAVAERLEQRIDH